MASLDRTLRRQLENTVKQARRVAEDGARKALGSLAVHHHEPHSSMSPEQRRLRNRLRAHGRQLGDRIDERRGTQTIDRLVGECAYEHWHRMLFARFLAENELLIEPQSGVAITLAECQELAREKGQDWLELASSYAVRMLQEVFRSDDPVLEVTLSPETMSALEDFLKKLPCDVFTASASLGWCYQFWQAERKDEVNAAGNKIGADELPAVTQLFTEDYMVDFLLDNTLGAWHAGKVLAANPTLAETAQSEEELRSAVALPGCPWKYLRFIRGEDGKWTPAADTFDGWPKTAKELTCLDPCMGSGHFVVAMFERLVALRTSEEKLDEKAAVAAVIRDNLFGLEIDARCTQIGAFNLALAAWRRVGHCTLPSMNLACSGLAPNTREADWVAIAGDNEKLQNGMVRLYRLFRDAPVLGSLINPLAAEGDLLEAGSHELQALLEKALEQETKDDTAHEIAVTAHGLAKATEILSAEYTLAITNVPYLVGQNQCDKLKDWANKNANDAKGDLAYMFVSRMLNCLAEHGSVAVVTPQNWLFQTSSKSFRERLLKSKKWNMVARLGPGAFETIGGHIVNVGMMIISNESPESDGSFSGLDVTAAETPIQKSRHLQGDTQVVTDAVETTPNHTMRSVAQRGQLKNPDARVTLAPPPTLPALEPLVICRLGLGTGDAPHYIRLLWEFSRIEGYWAFFQTTSGGGTAIGYDSVVAWDSKLKRVYGMSAAERKQAHNQDYRGREVWGKRGVSISIMSSLRACDYSGHLFDKLVATIVPKDPNDLPALSAYMNSPTFAQDVRKLDQKVSVTNATLIKVPFDPAHWKKVAGEEYPHGLPKPFSRDATQWLFNGHPKGADRPLHVAVARLLGYRWPRQTGSSFPDCPALDPDDLEESADDDGIVCLPPINREQPAATRLRVLLATAFGTEWNVGKERELLTSPSSKKTTLDDWLRDEFCEQHNALFHHRPFVWQVWDGRRDGFNALVNYHKLAAPNGEGRRTLEKLIYTYLGDWITQQRRDQQADVEGADARVAAAVHLQNELKRILEGEPPYDIFVRWKPLHEQSIGWDPDINDGVRLNIRPFMMARPLGARAKNACILRTTPKNIKWKKNRGKEPERPKEDYPWFWGWDEEGENWGWDEKSLRPVDPKKPFDGNRWNDLHYTNAVKQTARDMKTVESVNGNE